MSKKPGLIGVADMMSPCRHFHTSDRPDDDLDHIDHIDVCHVQKKMYLPLSVMLDLYVDYRSKPEGIYQDHADRTAPTR